MSAKTSLARRRAFFTALAETGNQTLAAERAKVSRSWVSFHRAHDLAFRAEMEAAIAAARRRLGGADGVRPAARWAAQDGEELVVRGSNGRRAQVARARMKQWTPRLEARFIAALEGCANICAACAAVGLTKASAFRHRQRWPDFAARWDAAIEEAQLRLEMALLAEAGRLLGTGMADEGPTEVPITGMTAEHALRLLRLRGKSYNRYKGRVGGPMARVTSEQTDASIRRVLGRMKRVEAWQARREGAGNGGGKSEG